MAESAHQFPAPQLTRKDQKIPGKISVGDFAEVRMEPGLMRFLYTPYPDEHGHRPGIHVHPMSGIPLGIGIHAAICAASGRETGVDVLRGCECSYESPIDKDEVVLARGQVLSLSPRTVRVEMKVLAEQDERLIMQGIATLVHVVEGKAVDISKHHGTS